jgi:hypothetical protein
LGAVAVRQDAVVVAVAVAAGVRQDAIGVCVVSG